MVRVVCTSVARVVARNFSYRYVRSRAGHPVSDFRTTTVTYCRVYRVARTAIADPADWKLLFLQFADNSTVFPSH